MSYDSSNTVGYFDPHEPIAALSGNLPHWRQEDVTYFITFRLADSLPQVKLDLWRRERDDWLARHPEPHDYVLRKDYHERFVERFQKWLDAGYGECVLKRPEVRGVVAEALKHFVDSRYALREWTVMPNHVHVIVTPIAGYDMSDILHSWKSYTANKLNRLLGRSGTLWQKETFDHIVRSPDGLERIEHYIHENPRFLSADQFTLHCLHTK